MYGDFNETYRIIIGNTETEIHIVKRAHIFSGYKPYFVRPGHIWSLSIISNINKRPLFCMFIMTLFPCCHCSVYFVFQVTDISFIPVNNSEGAPPVVD